MTKLVEIFQFTSTNNAPKNILFASKIFLEKSSKDTEEIDKVQKWLESIFKPGPYMFMNNDTQINYLNLCNSLNNGNIREMYFGIKSIRSEMLAITTGENLEEFKRINDFWESLELCFQAMIK